MSFGELSANAVRVLNKGAKLGHGGVLPGAEVSAEIAAARGVPMGANGISPPQHGEFTPPPRP